MAGIVALVLAGAACGSQVATEAQPSAAPAAPAVEVEPAAEHFEATAPRSEHSSSRQPGADDMRVAVVSPTDGSTFSDNVLELVVDTNGFDLSLAGMGKGDLAGQGTCTCTWTTCS